MWQQARSFPAAGHVPAGHACTGTARGDSFSLHRAKVREQRRNSRQPLRRAARPPGPASPELLGGIQDLEFNRRDPSAAGSLRRAPPAQRPRWNRGQATASSAPSEHRSWEGALGGMAIPGFPLQPGVLRYAGLPAMLNTVSRFSKLFFFLNSNRT